MTTLVSTARFTIAGRAYARGDRVRAIAFHGYGFTPGGGYLAPTAYAVSAQIDGGYVTPGGARASAVMPHGHGVLLGTGYVAPSAWVVSASFAPWAAYAIPSPPITITLPPDGRVFGGALGALQFDGTAVTRHGVRGSAHGVIPLAGGIIAETENTGRIANALGAVPLAGETAARHGVRAVAAGLLPITMGGAAVARHGVHATSGGAIGFVGNAPARHGVRVTADGAVPLRGVAGTTHGRYEVRGEVRLSPGGVLAQRTVRVYARDSGALVASGDSVGGYFRIACGFEPGEYVVLPIDLSPDATDFVPPVANRVVSVRAQDVWR